MSYIALVTELFPVFTFLILFKKIKGGKPLYLIALYSVLWFISNLIDLLDFFNLYASLEGYRKYFYSVVTAYEYGLFAAFIYHCIANKGFKKVIQIVSIGFFLFLFVYTYFSKFVLLDSIPIGIETILIFIFSIRYLFEQMNNQKVLFIYSQYPFWIIVGMMLYLAGSFFIFIFANQIPLKEVAKYWFIVDIFLILKNLFFTTGIITFALSRNEKTPPQVPTIKATF